MDTSKIFNRIVFTIFILIVTHISISIYIEKERAKALKGWQITSSISAKSLSSMIYQNQYPKNKLTLWLMYLGY